MTNSQAVLVSLALFAVLLSHQPDPKQKPAATNQQSAAVSTAEQATPPTPPILETFDAQPQLSLFPRIATYRPEPDDAERLPFWRSYLQHLQKTSGVAVIDQTSGNRVFAFKIIKGIDSISFFAPLAVTPNSRYRVTLEIRADLPEGGSVGAGIIEYDQFLWLAEQYPQSLDQQHRTGAQEGFRLTENSDWVEKTFTFTTGAQTGMVHLVIFREGTANRAPVMIDDLLIEKVE